MPDAETQSFLGCRALAVVKDAALAAAVGPAEALGDRHLLAVGDRAFVGAAVRPAEALGLGTARAPVDAAGSRAALM